LAGSFIPGLMFKGINEGSFEIDLVKEKTFDLILLELYIVGSIALMSILFFRS
jgi:hypothetical protein